MATVLVTDAQLGSAIAMIRSLGRAGHRVIAAADGRHSAGFRSRYAAGRLVHPVAADAPDAFVASILAAVERWAVDLVMPVSDAHIIPLTTARARLREAGAQLAVADDDALEVTRDKHRTIEMARSIGVPVPETVVVSDAATAVHEAPSLGWPVVLKPRFSRAVLPDGRMIGLEVAYANTVQELRQRIAGPLRSGDVLLQRMHRGEGHGVEMLAVRGDVLAAFQHRRLREVPFTGGASAYRESVPISAELLRHATSLIKALGWTGLAMVEFKVGQSGPVLLEINGRVWGSLPLAVKSGMDFPARYAGLLLNGISEPGEPDLQYRHGIRSRNMRLELVWIASVLRGTRRYPYLPHPSRLAGLRALLSLLRPSTEHDVLDLDDPGPGLADTMAALRHVTTKVFGGG